MKAEWKPKSEAPDGKDLLWFNVETKNMFVGHKYILNRDGAYLWTELPDPPEKPKMCKHCGEEIYHTADSIVPGWYHSETRSILCSKFEAEPRED